MFLRINYITISMRKELLPIIVAVGIMTGYAGTTSVQDFRPSAVDFPPILVADAAYDALLRIDGLSPPDESIDVLSFSWSASNAGSFVSGGGGGAGKVRFTDFSFVKKLDSTSPNMYKACAAGEHFPQIQFTAHGMDEDVEKTIEYRFSDVVITSVKASGNSKSADTVPVEEVSFSYGKMQWTYTEIDHNTGKTKTSTAQWDIPKNKNG
jgi:type VI secretion system secreted protein Hcp